MPFGGKILFDPQAAVRGASASADAVVGQESDPAAQLAALSAATGGWLWRVDADGVLRSATDGLSNLTGRSIRALTGKRLPDVLAPMAGDTGADSLSNLTGALSDRQPFRRLAIDLPYACGGRRWVELSADPLFGDGGGCVGMAGHARDVTEARAAHESAERAARRLREGVEAMSAGFALFGRDGRLALSNRAYRDELRGLGFDLSKDEVTFEQIVRRAVEKVGYARLNDADREALIVERLARYARADGLPSEQRTHDGRWFEMVERRTPDGDTVCVRTDVSSRRRAEQRLRDAFAFAPVGLAMFDADDRLTLWNRRFAELHPELAPKLREDAPLAALTAASTAHGGGGDPDGPPAVLRGDGGPPFTHACADGRRILAHETRLSDGGLMVVHVDITAMALLQEELALAKRSTETALQARTRFIANLSHELRTPMNAVMGYADLIAYRTRGPLEPAYVEFAERIKESARFLLSIVVDVLDMAKIEAGAMPVTREAIDAAAAVSQAVAMLAPLAEARGLTLRCKASEGLPPIWAERRRLIQIVQNLTSNAVKFTEEGGVVVSLALVAGAVEIVVADTGRGMSPEDIERALTPFGQVGGAGGRDYVDGTGLGLPLVRAMVELQDGAFAIDSAPGAGTRVTVRLPVAPPEAAQGSVA